MNAEELKGLMETWALSQREVARLFGVKDAAISCLLNGKYRRTPPYLQKSFLFFKMIPKRGQDVLVFEARRGTAARKDRKAVDSFESVQALK